MQVTSLIWFAFAFLALHPTLYALASANLYA